MPIYRVTIKEQWGSGYDDADTSETRIRITPGEHPIDPRQLKYLIVERAACKVFGRSRWLNVDSITDSRAIGAVYRPTRSSSSIVSWERTEHGRITMSWSRD